MAQNGIAYASGGADPNTYNYQADLFTGRFTYSVPITVAPARQGAEPKITLGYNSAGGDGWCGVGWSLDMGYIQRDTRHGVPIAWAQAYGTTNYLGYNVPLPQYDSSKGFVSSFGGASSTLVQVGPTNQNPIIYRQQVDTSFLTYQYFTNDYWVVIDKSGNSFFFGESTNSQMENTKTNWPQGVGSSTWRWALDRVVDVNGNETFLNYTLDRGALYLANIMYNANTNAPALTASDEVDFLLTNRPDTNFTFISGYRVTSEKLLSEIDVKAGGQNVRKYVLSYTESSSTCRSLLSTVTQYGSDFASSLPPVTFNYQVESFTFSHDTNWGQLYSQGQSGSWNYIRANDGSGYNVEMEDMDGDGLPDRVMRQASGSSYTNFYVQRNTGTGFAPATTNYTWGPLESQGNTGDGWNNPVGADSSGGTYADLVDVNGDGYPDRVMRRYNGPYTNFVVQLNNGDLEFSNDLSWSGVTNGAVGTNNAEWLAVQYNGNVALMDMNGDGLPDRVSSDYSSPYTNFMVQLNSGTNFGLPSEWGKLDSQGQTGQGWNALSQQDSFGNYNVMMIDLNGDGLPDRVMQQVNSPYTNFVVQFNNGAGFEPAEQWGPIATNAEGWLGPYSGAYVGLPIGDTICIYATLVDVNGDGLPDRVVDDPTRTNWCVQVNTGSGFSPPRYFTGIDYTNIFVDDTGGTRAEPIALDASGTAAIDFFDLNGDGLPDRIGGYNLVPSTNFTVQLNNGPFPDLLNVISNGLGGSVQVNYVASTTLDNRSKDWTNDPWLEGAQSLLPFNVWVVSQIVTSDGMGNYSTNSYAFKGGYYNPPEREFRGFSQCTQTDPLGTKTITYFHQSGGRDNSALGEYMDQGSESKKGIPFRVDVIGSDGTTNKITLNKIAEVEMGSNGWYFPCIAQTIEMNYEGLPNYRATAKQFTYDTNTENLVEEADLGEVTNVVFNGQTFTDVANDSIYTWITYTNFARPSDAKITSDSPGNSRLRETQMFYDSRGNLTGSQVWLNTAGAFVAATSTSYDQYGNPVQATDAEGVTTYTTYESTDEQYPVAQATGTFTNGFSYDVRSGLTLQAVDAIGLTASNSFDAFYRPTATYISTNAYGPAVLWKTKTTYSIGGIASGISENYILKQINNATDANGFETYSYLDGIGREVQTRTESEMTGQFRVVNISYDLRENVCFQASSYFSSGFGFTSVNGNYLGTLTEYDDVGRAYRVTPAVQGNFSNGILIGSSSTGGDAGSPVGAVTNAFVDGDNPWATVVTDSKGKVKKSYQDAYGRTVEITEVTSAGDYNTDYTYDLLGNLTNVTDSANNRTSMIYDSLGRKVSMTDPDMGSWSYSYDIAGRMTQQIDARGDKITFDYTDPLGRLVAKHIYNANGSLSGTVTYTYDASDDLNYSVYPGQLYKVTDSQGYQRYSYDVRGRVLKSARFLNVNAMEYVTASTYDDADRVQTVTYPGDAAVIQYSYDAACHLSQVQSLSGTGTNGPNYQDLTYQYDSASDVTNINDRVNSGVASATINAISYDDLYRVTSVNSAARGLSSYGYDSIGNILTNQDFGAGIYQYATQPHEVVNANGVSYAYDACGNMTARGGQTLTYDAQNLLIQVSTTNDTVRFGYDDSGERIWRAGTNGYAVWIGGIYEINNGKVLCHVFAGSRLIATFEPQCNAGLAKVFGQRNWYTVSTSVGTVASWPFRGGRGRWTAFGGMWTAILGVCMFGGRRIRIRKHEVRYKFRPIPLWKRVVTVFTISSMLLTGIGDVNAAPVYNPVFYFYSADYLGSSTVFTDRSGNIVQHYEYTPFGKTGYQNNTSAFAVSNRYTGQISDDETGLYYYHTRYYDPQLARFIQPDTMVPSATAPQTLNRYSYCANNPLNLTDASGNTFLGSFGKFFGAVFKAAINTWTSTQTWENVGIGLALGGLVGAEAALVASFDINVIVAATAYVAGPKGGEIAGLVSTVAFAGAGVASGVGMIGTNSAGAVATITGSTLQIASAAAGYAGDEDLSEDLGYASLGVSTAGYALLAYLTNTGNWVEPNNGKHANAIGITGINQTDNSGAQYMANQIGGPVLRDPSNGIVIDLLKVVWRMALFGAGDSIGNQFAEGVNQQQSGVIVYAHSGGAATAVFDALIGRFDVSVSVIKLYSSPVNALEVQAFGAISSEPFEFEPRHYFDMASFYGFSLNPVKFASGIPGVFLTSEFHNFNTYVHN